MAKDQNAEAAKKVAEAEKSSKKKVAGKDGQPNAFARFFKKIGQFFKDLKGETKKIIWPDAKTVWKSTGVVIVVVIIIGAGIWLVDFGLSKGIDVVLGIDLKETTSAVAELPEADEAEAEVVTEAATEAATEAPTEAATEAVTEAVSE